MQEVKEAIQKAIKDVYDIEANVVLTRPDEQFGDYATNVALQLPQKLTNPPAGGPREIAESLAKGIKSYLIEKVEAAGPGFINITLTDIALNSLIDSEAPKSLQGKVVVAEYSDPNPFKVLHAGHLYTSVVGDAIANLLENAGAVVHRVNFGGDVGMHVGKTMWAILQELGGENPGKLDEVSVEERSEWLAAAYIKGTNAFEKDKNTKQEITILNKRVYALHSDKDHDSPLAQIYWTTRQWSYEYFDAFYQRIGTQFEKYYPESAVADFGLKTVKEQLEKGVFEQSDGAVIFKGEDYGLHTRVFINSEGIPTYEAKDVGLIMTKWDEYHFDKSVVITGNEQAQYMQVVLKAVEQFAPELAKSTAHLTHGIVKLQGGVKMSSRKGNILRAVEVLDAAAQANEKATGKDDQQVVLGAVKYSFLKQRTGGDIVYEPEESVSLEGNSGPYLQYAHARAQSILRKSKEQKAEGKVKEADSALSPQPSALEASERSLVRKLGEYAEFVELATEELMPHHIATYLYELAQTFNRFYENNRVIDDPRESIRLNLVKSYATTLKNGLNLLGINAPESM